MPKKIDFQALAEQMLARADSILHEWFPAGRVHGREFLIGDLSGEVGQSLRVNLETGRWADFANPDLKGGDLISLYAAWKQCSQKDAANALIEQYGAHDPGPADIDVARRQPASPPEFGLAPADEPEPEMAMGGRQPSAVYTYKSGGRVAFYVRRFEHADGEKDFYPLSWNPRDKRWVNRAWKADRPMMGLDDLEKRPNKPVLVVEGEKTWRAAVDLLGRSYVVVTWSGGTGQWRATDWSPLKGRSVLFAPDGDRKIDRDTGLERPFEEQPGPKAMLGIIRALGQECRIIDASDAPEKIGGGDGWDIADAVGQGWLQADFVAWAKKRVKTIAVDEEKVEVDETLRGIQDAEEERQRQSSSLHGPALWESLGLALTNRGTPTKSIDNVLRILEAWEPYKGAFWYDAFYGTIRRKDGSEERDWTDHDTLALTVNIQRRIGMQQLDDNIVDKAVRLCAKRHPRNEPVEWLDSLEWDGINRLEMFFADVFDVDSTPYTMAVAKNFWISMVARIIDPGCKVDNMVILEGPQGALKSTSLEIIAGKYYTEMKESVSNKDFFMVLHGKFLVEIGELDAFSKAEASRIKLVVSSRSDRYRSPWARRAEDHPRSNIFVGTTNKKVYLRDETGGRRFWPIRCRRVDLSALRANRDHLFAEAVHRFRAGETWWEVPMMEAAAEQESRRVADPWEESIEQWLNEQIGIEQITTMRVMRKALDMEASRCDRSSTIRVNSIMQRLGYERAGRSNSDHSVSWEKAQKGDEVDGI